MQFKTLALVAIAAVAVSAQLEDNPCTRCVLRSYPNDSSCKTLSAEDLNKIREGLSPNGAVNPVKLAEAVQKPEIRACVCHWSGTAFVTGGAASSCISGATPICNAAQRAQVNDGLSNLGPFLGCGAA
ncbi:MAG: hypothetical protein J3Q66DRAFT_355218 [Benniella sp.]|nr:MAG: hypothetical protein J3Q66DRAFT_355218 [Benniella sp.]